MSDKFERAVTVIENLTSIVLAIGKAIARGDERTVDAILGFDDLESRAAMTAERLKTREAFEAKQREGQS